MSLRSRFLPALLYFSGSFVAIMSAEGNMRSFREAVEGEPMVSDYHTVLQATMVPSVAKYAIGAVLGSRVRMLFEASRKYYEST